MFSKETICPDCLVGRGDQKRFCYRCKKSVCIACDLTSEGYCNPCQNWVNRERRKIRKQREQLKKTGYPD